MTTEIITPSDPAPMIAIPPQTTPDALILYAMDKGADLERLEKLYDLKTRFAADQARQAYVVDMTEFKKNPPQIIKDKLVEFSGTSYKHATLGAVTQAIVDGLAQHGFSHRWDTKNDGAKVIVTCILTHRLGHSENTTLECGKDESGKKNAIQAMASAVTYLQRYTLLAATGLATHDQDDDGQASEDTSTDKLIADAFRAPDMKTLQSLWERGQRLLRGKDGVSDDYAYFRNAVNCAKALLTPPPAGSPGISSRLSAIVGAGIPKAEETAPAEVAEAAQEGGAA